VNARCSVESEGETKKFVEKKKPSSTKKSCDVDVRHSPTRLFVFADKGETPASVHRMSRRTRSHHTSKEDTLPYEEVFYDSADEDGDAWGHTSASSLASALPSGEKLPRAASTSGGLCAWLGLALDACVCVCVCVCDRVYV
jgi:hypothetical protein